MKKLLSFVALIIILSSCKETLFLEKQPNFKKDKTAFAKKMRGVYLDDKNEEVMKISSTYAELSDNNEFESMKFDLKSDTCALRKWRGIWFFNIKPSDDDFWRVAFIELKKDSIMLSYMNDEPEKLEELTKVRREKNMEGDYLINPSRKELKIILKEMSFNSQTFYKKQD